MTESIPETSGQPPTTLTFAEAFGRTVQVLRTDAGWSRAELAKRASISYSYLSAIETGTKPPSGKMQQVLANALGVMMHELIETAERRLSPSGPDAELTAAMEVEQALIRRDRRLAARETMHLPPNENKARPLNDLLGMLAEMDDDDVALLLDLARRLRGKAV